MLELIAEPDATRPQNSEPLARSIVTGIRVPAAPRMCGVQCAITIQSGVRYRVFEREGAYDRSQLRDLIRRGSVAPASLIAIDGTEDWKEASTYPELKRYFELAATQPKDSPEPLNPTSPAMPMIGWRFWSAVGLTIGGVILVVIGFRDIVLGIRSSQWPSVEAQNLSAQVITRSERPGLTRDFHAGYDYRVDGRRYTNSLVSYGTEWKTLVAPRSQAKAIYDEQPRVHYDPAVPSRAVLHPGITFGSLFDVVAGLAAIVGGLLLGRGNAWVRTLIDTYRSAEKDAETIGSYLDT
jgi:hypothetical protein